MSKFIKMLVKKTILVFSIFISAHSHSFSQGQADDHSDLRNRFTFSGGVSFAVSDFGSTDLLNDGAGFAKTGMGFNFSYTRFLHETFGLVFTVGYDGHSFNSEEYIKQFATLDPPAVWHVVSDPWVTKSFLFGIVWHMPEEKFEFDLKAQFGISNTTYPKFSMTKEIGYYLPYAFENDEAKENAFTGALGISLGYWITDNITLHANFDFRNHIVEFDKINIVENGEAGYQGDRQSVSVIQTSLGVSYTFGK